jgi:hypothetical protein
MAIEYTVKCLPDIADPNEMQNKQAISLLIEVTKMGLKISSPDKNPGLKRTSTFNNELFKQISYQPSSDTFVIPFDAIEDIYYFPFHSVEGTDFLARIPNQPGYHGNINLEEPNHNVLIGLVYNNKDRKRKIDLKIIVVNAAGNENSSGSIALYNEISMAVLFNNKETHNPVGQTSVRSENVKPIEQGQILDAHKQAIGAVNEITFRKPANQNKNSRWVNTVLFIGFLLVYSLLAGYGFSWLFSTIVQDPLDEVLPICFWFGPLTALYFAFQRFVLGKLVETSFPYSDRDVLTDQINLACEKLNYSLTSNKDESVIWSTKNSGLAAINLEPISVQMKEGTATVTGQIALLHRVLADLGIAVKSTPSKMIEADEVDNLPVLQPTEKGDRPAYFNVPAGSTSSTLSQAPNGQPSTLGPLPPSLTNKKPGKNPKKGLAIVIIGVGVIGMIIGAILIAGNLRDKAQPAPIVEVQGSTLTDTFIPSVTSTAAFISETNVMAFYDFSVDNGEWPTIDTTMDCGNERLRTVDGVLEWTILDNDRSCFWSEYPFSDLSLTAFDVSVEAQRVYGANTDDYGLIFITDEGYSYDIILSDFSHTFSVWMCDPSGWQELVPTTYNSAIISGGVNLIRAVSNGESTTFFVNEFELATIDVNGISPVYFGVTADVYVPGSEMQLRFDNFRISSVTSVEVSENTPETIAQNTESTKPENIVVEGLPIDPAHVSGRVYIPMQDRGWNTSVELYDPNGDMVDSFPTDQNGNFDITISTSGTYRLVVWLYRDSVFLLENCQNATLNDANWEFDYDGSFDVNTGLHINYLYYYSPEFTLNGGEMLEYTLELPCP